MKMEVKRLILPPIDMQVEFVFDENKLNRGLLHKKRLINCYPFSRKFSL